MSSPARDPASSNQEQPPVATENPTPQDAEDVVEGSDAWKIAKYDSMFQELEQVKLSKTAQEMSQLNIATGSKYTMKDLSVLFKRQAPFDRSLKIAVINWLAKELTWLNNLQFDSEQPAT